MRNNDTNNESRNQMSEAIEAMKTKIATLTDTMILDAIKTIGGELLDISTEKRITRAYLIEEYATRNGFDAADELMDSIGM